MFLLVNCPTSTPVQFWFIFHVLESILLSQLLFMVHFSFSIYRKYCFVLNKGYVKMSSFRALASFLFTFQFLLFGLHILKMHFNYLLTNLNLFDISLLLRNPRPQRESLNPDTCWVPPSSPNPSEPVLVCPAAITKVPQTGWRNQHVPVLEAQEAGSAGRSLGRPGLLAAPSCSTRKEGLSGSPLTGTDLSTGRHPKPCPPTPPHWQSGFQQRTSEVAGIQSGQGLPPEALSSPGLTV